MNDIDKGIIARIRNDGLLKHDATIEDVAVTVFTAIQRQLADGKSVTIAGVGRLTTKLKRERLKMPTQRHLAVERRYAALTKPVIVTQGEPYEVD